MRSGVDPGQNRSSTSAIAPVVTDTAPIPRSDTRAAAPDSVSSEDWVAGNAPYVDCSCGDVDHAGVILAVGGGEATGRRCGCHTMRGVQEGRASKRESLEDRFFMAAGMIVASIIAIAAGGDHEIGQMIIVVVQSLTLLVILYASHVQGRTLRVAAVLVTLASIGTILSVALDKHSIGPALIGSMLALVGPVAIIRRVRHHARIDLETVAASLCVYLLAGLFFALIFRVIELLGDPFFVQRTSAKAIDFVYFSFTTITTLGYGDLTPARSLGKMLAVSEALFGQLYLVSVVALLVGNLGRARAGASSPAPSADVEDDDS